MLSEALALIADAVVDGERLRNPASFCYLLSSAACPVALWLGEDDLARHYADLLAKDAAENGFTYMGELAAWFSVIGQLRTGKLDPASAIYPQHQPLRHDKTMFVTTCVTLCDEETVERARAEPPHWATAEIFRAYGEACLQRGDEQSAHALFVQAMSIAQSQGNRLWTLRIANSLSRLLEPDEAMRLVETSLSGVDQSTRSPDVQTALQFLANNSGKRHQNAIQLS